MFCCGTASNVESPTSSDVVVHTKEQAKIKRRSSTKGHSKQPSTSIGVSTKDAFEDDRRRLSLLEPKWSCNKVKGYKDRNNHHKAMKVTPLSNTFMSTSEEVSDILLKYSVPAALRRNTVAEAAAWQRGISVAFLLWMTSTYDLWSWKTWQVVEYFVVPITSSNKKKIRFTEDLTVVPFVGNGDFYVSHSWEGCWGDLVASVAFAMPLSKTVVIDCLALSQHKKSSAAKEERETALEVLDDSINNVRQGVLVICNPALKSETIQRSSKSSSKSISLKRTWCLYEIGRTQSLGRPIYFQLGRVNSAKKFVPFEYSSANFTKQLFPSNGLQGSYSKNKADKEMLVRHVKTGQGLEFFNLLVQETIQSGIELAKFPAFMYSMLDNKEALKSVDPKLKDPENGKTLLHLLAKHGYADLLGEFIATMKLLEEDMDIMDKNGNTPLLDAALEGQVESMKVLLLNGASRLITTRDGLTPLQVAVENSAPEKVGLVRRAFLTSKSTRSMQSFGLDSIQELDD